MKNSKPIYILLSSSLILTSHNVFAESERKSLNAEEFKNCAISSMVLKDVKSDYKKSKPAYDALKHTEKMLELESKKLDRIYQEIEDSNVDSSSPEYKIKNHNHKVRQYQELQERYNERVNNYQANKEKNVEVRGGFLLAEMLLDRRKEDYKNACGGKLTTKKSIIKEYCGFEITGFNRLYSESTFCARWKKPEKS